MRKTILTAFTLIVSVSAMAQSKNQVMDMPDCGTLFETLGNPCKTPVFANGKLSYYTVKNPVYTTSSTSNLVGLTSPLKPIGLFVWSTGSNKPILRIDNPSNGWNNPIDSIVMHVNKSQIHWLNDSTVIVHKP